VVPEPVVRSPPGLGAVDGRRPLALSIIDANDQNVGSGSARAPSRRSSRPPLVRAHGTPCSCSETSTLPAGRGLRELVGPPGKRKRSMPRRSLPVALKPAGGCAAATALRYVLGEMPIVGTRAAMSRDREALRDDELDGRDVRRRRGAVAVLPSNRAPPSQRSPSSASPIRPSSREHGHDTSAPGASASSPARRSRYPWRSTAAAAASSPSGRSGARSRAIFVGEPLVLHHDRDRASLPQPAHEGRRLRRLRPLLPGKRQRQADHRSARAARAR